MRFRNEMDLYVGMRVYTFINEDEYELLTIVAIDEANKLVTLLDSETSEVVELSKEIIDKHYTLLDDFVYDTMALAKIDDEYYVLCNDDIKTHLQCFDWFECITYAMYDFETKYSFTKFLKYITNWSDKSVEAAWSIYISNQMNKNKIFDYKNHKEHNIKLLDIIEDKTIKLSDAFFDDIEDELLTHIVEWNIFFYEPSIRLDMISDQYFFMYSEEEDIYAIFTARTDDIQYISESMDIDTYLDVYEFMNQK